MADPQPKLVSHTMWEQQISNTSSPVSSVHICPQTSGHWLLTWFRGILHIWNLGDRGRFCNTPSCLRASPQIAVFPPDTGVSGVAPRALVTIWVPAVVHFQATANPKTAWSAVVEESSSSILLQHKCQ